MAGSEVPAARSGVPAPPRGNTRRRPLVKQAEARQRDLHFEYDQLRKEILQNQQQVITILQLSLAASGALLAVSINNVNFRLLLLIVQVINLSAAWQSINKERSTFLIASYLRTFIEKKLTNVLWERRLRTQRKINLNWRDLPTSTPLIIYLGISLASSLLVILGIYSAPTRLSTTQYIEPATQPIFIHVPDLAYIVVSFFLLLVMVFFMWMRYIEVTNFINKYRDNWIEIELKIVNNIEKDENTLVRRHGGSVKRYLYKRS